MYTMLTKEDTILEYILQIESLEQEMKNSKNVSDIYVTDLEHIKNQLEFECSLIK